MRYPTMEVLCAVPTSTVHTWPVQRWASSSPSVEGSTQGCRQPGKCDWSPRQLAGRLKANATLSLALLARMDDTGQSAMYVATRFSNVLGSYAASHWYERAVI